MGMYVLCLSCAQSFQGVVTHMSLVEEVAAGSRFLIKDNSLSEAFDWQPHVDLLIFAVQSSP